ncbi:MAG TPA: acyltransferase [Geminicoccaceae bacterium]|nr:acyltransferase [Geminicoccaceae bacterium]
MIWSLQVLRFVAALMVVYVHAAQTALTATGSNGLVPHHLGAVGLSGVDVFFVVSGVIIARIAPGRTAREFAWSRFRRIVPFYLLCCIPFLFMSMRTGWGWRDGLATFLLWPATDVMTAPILPVAWTLCFEMVFYLAAALILVDRRWAYALPCLYALAFLLRPLGPVFQFLGNPIILEFLLGVAIAFAPARRAGIWGIPLGAAALVGAGFFGIAPSGGTMEFLAGENGLQRVLVYGLPAAAIVYGTLQVRAQESVWTYLGGGSYALYLTHTLPVSALLGLWTVFPVAADVIVLVGVLVSVLLAWRVHELFEKPILKALREPRRRSAGPIRRDAA